MAISKEQLTVEVVLDSSGAVKGIKDLEGKFVDFDKLVSQSTKTTDKASDANSKLGLAMESVSSTLSKAALPLLAVQAAVGAVNTVFGLFSSTLGSFVDDYARAEKAQILLTQAIENSNGRIKNTSDAWGAYLDSLQEVKNVDGDVLRGFTAQAIQMGFSEAQVKSLITATIQLSKASGDSLDGAFQRMIATTNGMIRGVSILVPELKNLSTEALQNGDAFDVVANTLGKVATGTGSYASTLTRAKLAAGELSEDIGKLILDTLNIKGAIDVTTVAINSVRNAIANVDFDALRLQFSEFIKVAGPATVAIGLIAAAYTGLASAAIAASLPVIIVTGKIALIGLAIGGTIAAIEMIIRNFGLFEDAMGIIANSIAYLIVKPFGLAALAAREFFGLFGTDNAFYKAADKAFKDVEKSLNSVTASITKNTGKIASEFKVGFSGEVVKQGINFIKGLGGEVDRTSAKLKTLGETGSRVKIIDEKVLEKAKTLTAELAKMANDLNLEAQKRGASELEQAQLVYEEHLKTIDAKQQELVAIGQLTEANKVVIQQAKDAAKANLESTISQIENKDTLEQIKKAEREVADLKQKSLDTMTKIEESNLGTFDLIQSQYETELKKLDKLEEQLNIRGDITEAEREALDLARETAKFTKEAAESKATEQNIKGLISAAGSGAQAVISTAITQIGAAFGPEGEIVAGMINLLSQGGDKMKELGKGLVDTVTNLPKNISEGAVGLVQSFIDGLSAFLKDQKAVESFINNMVTLMPKVMAAFVAALPQLIVALSRPIFWITIAKAWVRAMIDSVVDLSKALIQAMKDAGQELKNAFNQAVEAVGTFFAEIGPKIWESIKGAFENPGEFFTNLATKLWDAVKAGASAVWDAVSEFGTKIWEGLKSSVDEIGEWFKTMGGKIWEGLKNVFTEIANAFSGLGKGIWNGLVGEIRSAGGKIAKWLGFSEGGIVPGYARLAGDSYGNDVVPAMLSPGEAVIPRSMMANPEISRFVKDLLRNKTMPGFSLDQAMPRLALANGGIVPMVKGNTGQTFGDTNVNVVLKIETNQAIDEAFIRQRLMPALKSELKASSLRGDFILSAKGVRG